MNRVILTLLALLAVHPWARAEVNAAQQRSLIDAAIARFAPGEARVPDAAGRMVFLGFAGFGGYGA